MWCPKRVGYGSVGQQIDDRNVIQSRSSHNVLVFLSFTIHARQLAISCDVDPSRPARGPAQ